MSEAPVSLREFTALVDRTARLETRLDAIDREGTRGMAAVQLQITDMVRDVSEMRAENKAWQQGHEGLHDREQADRRSGRRWLVTIGAAWTSSMAAVFALLAEILHHLPLHG